MIYPSIELRLSDMLTLAGDAVFAGTATHLDYSVLAASDAMATLGNEAASSNDLLVSASETLADASQSLVEAINLSFSDSFAFLDSVTLVPA